MYRGLNNLGRYLLAGAGAIGIVAGSGLSVAKATTLEELQAQLSELQRQVNEAKAAAAAAQAAAANSGGGDLDLKIKWKGAPEFSSRDGKFKMKVRGRIQADYNAIDQDFPITGRPDVNAAELRRARLGAEGTVFYTLKYKFEVDFADDETAIKDAYLEYTGLMDGLALRAGNFKTPNSLDEMTSSRFITFMERAAFVGAFGLDRQIGAGAVYNNDHFTLSAGVFGPTPEDDSEWMDDVRTGAARVTFAPINRDVNGVHQVVHLGASWRTREGAEDLRSPSEGSSTDTFNDQFFRYRARGADLHLADRFIATPQIFTEDTFWGVEGAVIWGPWHVVGEYTELEAKVASGTCVAGFDDCFPGDAFFPGSNPTYNGWYVETGFFLTGETRSYKKGAFGRVKVKNPVIGGGKGGGWGAWQIAGRYDVIDLTSNATTFVGIRNAADDDVGFECTQCGEQETWLIGVNWWLNDYTRFLFNYNESDIKGGALLLPSGASANKNNGATIRGFGMRAQVDW